MINAEDLMGSNRPGHLAAAAGAAAFFVLAGLIYSNTYLIKAGATIFLWELIATPDVDHDSRKVFHGSIFRIVWALYWCPYKKAIPHRSAWSHSLMRGLPVRFAYLTFPVWIGTAIQTAEALLYVLDIYGPAALTELLVHQGQAGLVALLTMQLSLAWTWLPLGCALGDLIHLLKDDYLRRYGIDGLLWGKPN